jgi:hypothetical protein
MRPATVLKKFNQRISIWEKGFDNYTLQQLLMKPDDENWSLGQVYVHLIDNTVQYNIKRIEICISSNKNAAGIKSPEGEMVYSCNAFPPVKLKSPRGLPKQPELLNLKKP